VVYELTQNNLRLLESFSIEEKLNFPLVAFEQDIFSMDGALESDVYLERMAEESRHVPCQEHKDEVASEARSND